MTHNLASTIAIQRALLLPVYGYGTSEGVEKAWDTRGRGRHTPLSNLMSRVKFGAARARFGLTKLYLKNAADQIKDFAGSSAHQTGQEYLSHAREALGRGDVAGAHDALDRVEEVVAHAFDLHHAIHFA